MTESNNQNAPLDSVDENEDIQSFSELLAKLGDALAPQIHIGQQFACVAYRDEKNIYFLGNGTYVGDDRKPGVPNTQEPTLDGFVAFVEAEEGIKIEKDSPRYKELEEQMHLPHFQELASLISQLSNIKSRAPKFVLDNGDVVYGHEVHFSAVDDYLHVVGENPEIAIQPVVIERNEEGVATGFKNVEQKDIEPAPEK